MTSTVERNLGSQTCTEVASGKTVHIRVIFDIVGYTSNFCIAEVGGLQNRNKSTAARHLAAARINIDDVGLLTELKNTNFSTRFHGRHLRGAGKGL